MQVVDSTGKVLFQQPPAGTVAVPVDTLPAGGTLAQNQRLYSQSGQYFLQAQSTPAWLWKHTLHARMWAPG